MTAPSRFYSELYADLGLFAGAATRVVRHHTPTPDLAEGEITRIRDEAMMRRKSGAALRVLYIGQVAEHKGLDVLLAATKLTTSFELRIAGAASAGDRNSWQAQGATPLGSLAGAAKWRELASADVVCLPALWPENAPLVVNEAFAVGVPVVATRVGGLPEMVDTGTNGLLVSPDDPHDLAKTLDQVAHEPGLHDRLANGARSLERRSRETMVEEYVAVFRDATTSLGRKQ